MSNEREIGRQTAALVAECMDGWKVDTSESYDDYPGAYIDGPDGARLYLRLDWRNKDRVEITSSYPKNEARPTQFEIGVSRDRGPQVIAREIERRLLPKYLPELVKVRESIETHTRAAAARLELAEELMKVLPGASLDHDADRGRTKVSFYGRGHEGYGNIEIYFSGDSASIKLHSAPADMVRRVARAIAGE